MFEATFPYSKIAKGYKQNKTQSNYTIQYGIFPYLKDLLPEDLKDTVFTIKFDEPSTQQVNKQYDGHVQYPSKNYAHQNCILWDHHGRLLPCRRVARSIP